MLQNSQHSIVALLAEIFSRMHDLIVDELVQLSPNLSDDDLFLIARQINVAMYQQVFYNDILGTNVGTDNDLVNSYEDTFDPTLSPQAFLEYYSACGRFLHILSPDDTVLSSCNNCTPIQKIPFGLTYFDDDLAINNAETMTCGSACESWKLDGLASGVQNLLFMNPANGYGNDLFATDIMRNRESCLEPYINYIKRLFGICINSWDDLKPFLPSNAIKEFKKLYGTVKDLELVVAGYVESVVGDSAMGRVCTDLSIKQYDLLKRADPKFFTHSLTEEQLDEIAKMDWTCYVCIAVQLTKSLRDMKYSYVEGLNDIVDCKCKNLSSFNLSLFL